MLFAVYLWHFDNDIMLFYRREGDELLKLTPHTGLCTCMRPFHSIFRLSYCGNVKHDWPDRRTRGLNVISSLSFFFLLSSVWLSSLSGLLPLSSFYSQQATRLVFSSLVFHSLLLLRTTKNSVHSSSVSQICNNVFSLHWSYGRS